MVMFPETPNPYRVSYKTLAEIEQACTEYKQVVETSGMALTSRKTYIIHADQFVRWLKR